MTIPSPQEVTPCSGADLGQEENDPQHSSVLVFVMGGPKQQSLTLGSHKAITSMWHFIVQQNVSRYFLSYFSAPTQVLLQIKYLSIMIDMYDSLTFVRENSTNSNLINIGLHFIPCE